VEPGLLEVYRATEPDYRPVIGQIQSVLSRRFVLVANGGDGVWTPPFHVYRRRSAPPAAGLGPGAS
jgi:hypothetical protein